MRPDDDVPVPEPTPPVTDPHAPPAPGRPPAPPGDDDEARPPPPVELPGRDGLPERVTPAGLSRA